MIGCHRFFYINYLVGFNTNLQKRLETSHLGRLFESAINYIN
jgi:hypothetical protein